MSLVRRDGRNMDHVLARDTIKDGGSGTALAFRYEGEEISFIMEERCGVLSCLLNIAWLFSGSNLVSAVM
jgi:hypothetical protein